jgi:ketosteroid isomerase-like protein
MAGERDPSSDAQLTLRVFEHVKRREWDSVLSLAASDAVWDMTPVGLGTFHGHDQVRQMWEEWSGAYEEWDIDIDLVDDLGNGVVFVVNHQQGRLAGSSGHVRARGAFLFRWIDGRIAQATIFPDAEEGHAAAQRVAASVSD